MTKGFIDDEFDDYQELLAEAGIEIPPGEGEDNSSPEPRRLDFEAENSVPVTVSEDVVKEESPSSRGHSKLKKQSKSESPQRVKSEVVDKDVSHSVSETDSNGYFRTPIYLYRNDYVLLRAYCIFKRVSMSDVVRKLVKDFIKSHKDEILSFKEFIDYESNL